MGDGERGGMRLWPTTKCRGYPTLDSLWPFWGKGWEVGKEEGEGYRALRQLANRTPSCGTRDKLK
jgi:hypothetical protein